ncbi:DoxX family protein [Engelhardtia mirabilis]
MSKANKSTKLTSVVPAIAGVLLGLAFLAAGLTFLLDMVPEQPDPPEGSPMALFMGAMVPTGYMAFVKVCEVAGGALVMIPRLRRLGLLILCPIIVNIVAFHVFITGGEGLMEPMFLGVVGLAVFLLLCEWRAFLGLVARRP